MACAAPVTAWRPATGGPLLFKPPKDGHYYTQLEVPCGTCILCRGEQARQWAVRITHEAQQHETSSFVTLTYSDEHLPEHNSLCYRDLQLFFKRLRKQMGKFRYYAVGEYGDKTLRPHYHACIFGHAFEQNRLIVRETPTLLWTQEWLCEVWGKGHVSVGALNYQTAAYTASYIQKKLTKKQQYVRVDEETGELIRLEQPRALMSRRPGIGREWYEQHKNYTYNHDHVVINGTPAKPPKYYDNLLKKENEKWIKEIKLKRSENATPATDEQLRARARNAHARAKFKTAKV